MKCFSDVYFYPLLLDAISAANPRVIDDSRARKLSNDLKRCTYYETCSTYGLNVERVFQDGERSNTGTCDDETEHESGTIFKCQKFTSFNFSNVNIWSHIRTSLKTSSWALESRD